MPTTKQRIALALDPDLDFALRAVAERANVPVATKAAELLREALEMHEDIVFAQLADSRMKGKAKWLSHDQVWK